MGAYLADNPEWLPAEVLVVDDGSTDGTADAAGSVQLPEGIDLRVLIHPVNPLARPHDSPRTPALHAYTGRRL